MGPEGYNLMDCTGYNEATMKDCDHESDSMDRVSAVVYHGADLQCMADRNAHCSASGYTDEIRVQATCCKINMLHKKDVEDDIGVEGMDEIYYYYIDEDD